jgi:glycosyltransferase involved in cell wall biosynthesis
MMPTFSVIIPNYNHAPHLPRRIESVLAQTHRDFELLILDDCSPDNSREIMDRYVGDSRVRLEFNHLNSGNPYVQWQKGLKLTSGDYIWIAESDDFADPQLLERLGATLDPDPDIGLAFCETLIVDESGTVLGWHAEHSEVYDAKHRELLGRAFVMEGRDYLRNFMFPWNTIPNASAVLFRRSALESIGGPVTSMRLCGDWLTYSKILSRFKIGHVPDRLNYFRDHQMNVRSHISAGVLAREWIEVAKWGERECGKFSQRTRRELDRFAANALLHVERLPPGNGVPFRRMPSALIRAARLDPGLLLPTAVALLRQSVGSVARRVLSA